MRGDNLERYPSPGELQITQEEKARLKGRRGGGPFLKNSCAGAHLFLSKNLCRRSVQMPGTIIVTMQDLTDEELVANFRSDGGPPAGNKWIDELFGRYHSRVALWCNRFTGERQLAGDLAQDVFLRAYRNIDSYRGQAKFSTWLYTIARNHCINEMKSRSVRPEQTSDSLELDIEDSYKESILASLEREQSLRSMRAFVNETLDDTEKRVMVLHFGDEIGLEAVTRLLQLKNPSGARAYVVSAKRKLSAALQRWKANEQHRRNISRGE
jgi:RNA polymerase sigma factor (sigma-70 family)